LVGLRSACKRLALGLVLVCLATAAAGATPASAFVTASKWGYVGRLLLPYYHQNLVVCSAYQDNTRTVTAGGTRVKPAWRYRHRRQVIRQTAHLEVWNGANWGLYSWSPWQARRVAPGHVARFTGTTFQVPRGPAVGYGYDWRVKQVYRWKVAGRLVGERAYLFEALEYYANEGRNYTIVALQGEIIIDPQPVGVPSSCWMP
jgi:hypothetical protein